MKVLLFNSRLKFFAGKLKSRWSGPYIVQKVFPYGVLEVMHPETKKTEKVNGHRVKQYLEAVNEVCRRVEEVRFKASKA